MPRPSDLPTGADVRAGLASGDPDRFEALFDALWYDLPGRFAPEVLHAVQGLPPTTVEARPRLAHAALLAHHRTGLADGDLRQLRRARQLYTATGLRFGRRLASVTRPGDLGTAGTVAVVAERLRGDHERAERLGAWTDAQTTLGTGHQAASGTGAAARPGWLSAERGLAALLAGAFDRATRLLTRAHAEAGDPPHAHFAAPGAAAHLALLTAYRGHLDLSRSWLTAAEESGTVDAWITRLTGAGAEIARALTAVHEGDATRAAQLLHRIEPATEHLDLWPFVAHAAATYEASFGDPQRGLRLLDRARHEHGALHPDPTTLTGELVLRAEATLLLRAGAGTRVLHLADRYAEVDSLVLHAAWAHALAGEHHEAARLSAEALQHRDLPVGDLMGHHLVQAVTALRSGQRERAGDSFRTAVGLRSTPAHVLPFLTLPRDVLGELAALARVPDPLRTGTVTVRHVPPPPEPLVHLTPREREVLRALATGLTAEQAAARFGVAVTTVRTQIRSVYRKLRVSRRREALARAQELGLLRVPRHTHDDAARTPGRR
ncbi:LuxR C-terminal-related transcriptional regulator [Promicromonospora sp. NPDC050880]|uniref:LuxR C-terminal-related transcriptional regulator n=1 Tax=Promicromonospora sp. NPDC050880 TaxID=3364406 RepID=UPI0037A7D1EB